MPVRLTFSAISKTRHFLFFPAIGQLKDGDIRGDQDEDVQKENGEGQRDVGKEKGFDEFIFVIVTEKLEKNSYKKHQAPEADEG